jgi:hypothetical protein
MSRQQLARLSTQAVVRAVEQGELLVGELELALRGDHLRANGRRVHGDEPVALVHGLASDHVHLRDQTLAARGHRHHAIERPHHAARPRHHLDPPEEREQRGEQQQCTHAERERPGQRTAHLEDLGHALATAIALHRAITKQRRGGWHTLLCQLGRHDRGQSRRRGWWQARSCVGRADILGHEASTRGLRECRGRGQNAYCPFRFVFLSFSHRPPRRAS